MSIGFLSRAPVAVVFLGFVAGLFAVVEIGRWLGGRDREDCDEDSRLHANTLSTAMLGLLALLLGFTFSMAAQHFVVNRDLVVTEANAIKTAYLRADMAAEPQRAALKATLRRYLDTRVAFYEAGMDARKRRAVEAQSEWQHAELWKEAAAVAARSSGYTSALLVDSVNQVINVHDARVDAARNHVPPVIYWLLAAFTAASMELTGYVSGFGNRRLSVPTGIVIVLVSLVVAVIIDLDRPMRGLIHGGQESLLDLQESWRQLAEAAR